MGLGQDKRGRGGDKKLIWDFDTSWKAAGVLIPPPQKKSKLRSENKRAGHLQPNPASLHVTTTVGTNSRVRNHAHDSSCIPFRV